MKTKLKKCLECGADLVYEARDVPFTYKGKATIVHNLQGVHCNKCDFSLLDEKDQVKFEKAIQTFVKKTNSELVSSEFIKEVREKLGLGKVEAAEIFGGGINAFNRYEEGKATPPVALVKLFQVLDKHPELLTEIRG